MKLRALLRVVLSLLIAVVQLAGMAIATPSTNSPEKSVYFCCCVGVCSCTSDCCNHEPTVGGNRESPVTRIGAAGSVLEAPKSCGVWRATLLRGHSPLKVVAANDSARFAAPPIFRLLGSIEKTPLVPINKGLQPCSPRAPPSTRVRT